MKRYFCYVIALAKEKRCRTVVEIGSIRNTGVEWIEGDGHATLHWVEHFEEVYSYDIDKKATELTNILAGSKKNLIAECRDGVEALQNFPKRIDLLYLDAWDVIPGTDYREKHLEAFQKAEDKLHENSMILIDDMEYGQKGKGGLIIPYAIIRGWIPLTLGKQMLLTRTHSPFD